MMHERETQGQTAATRQPNPRPPLRRSKGMYELTSAAAAS